MKQQVIYIHGGDSFASERAFLEYLRTTPIRDPLGERGEHWPNNLRPTLGGEYEVYMPTMPNKYNARYEEWAVWFERFLELVSDGVILVGWSLGGMFLAKYLSEKKPIKKPKALFLLAAPGGGFVDQTGQGGDCASFRPNKQDIARLTEIVPHVEIWHSEDDFVVPVTEADWYKTHIPTAKVVIFKDKNHFLVPELPELVAAIKALP